VTHTGLTDAAYCWLQTFANKLATLPGSEDLAILTDLSNSGDMSWCELDKNNIVNFTDEELSLEYRQDMEDFMKK
jgi:hypothetical protein